MDRLRKKAPGPLDIAVIEGRKKTDEQAIDIQTLTESYPDEIITVEKNNSQPGLLRRFFHCPPHLESNTPRQ